MRKGSAPLLLVGGQGRLSHGSFPERSEAWTPDQAPKQGAPVQGSATHVASSGERLQYFCLLGRDGAHWKQSHYFPTSQPPLTSPPSHPCQEATAAGFSFAATHPGLRQREGGTDWSRTKRVWSGRHCRETRGIGCWVPCVGTYLNMSIPQQSLFLRRASTFQGKNK